MKFYLLFFFITFSSISFSQDINEIDTIKKKSLLIDKDKLAPKANFDQYKIISINRDTIYIDSSLTLKSLYKFNYLRKDNFGLLPFANEGQTYNTLNFQYNQNSIFPEFGFKAKHFSFYEANQIKYYSVATPTTELYFKTVMEQGQTLDALITVNTSERLNMSIGFKGLRSVGKYINQLSSSGNFVFTTSYQTKNKRYNANFHYTGQDILNGENGGIINLQDFQSGNNDFKNRVRIDVYSKDATSFLKGKRFFLDHKFRINASQNSNNINILHQVNYENKFFEYAQPNLSTNLNNISIQKYGTSFVASNLQDQTKYNKLYNKLALQLENSKLGDIQFFVEDFRDNTYFNKILILNNILIPSSNSNQLNLVGGQFNYSKNTWKGIFQYSKSISNQTTSNLNAKIDYKLNENYKFSFQLENTNRLPNTNYILHQSNYVNYNWFNNFKNEKINNIQFNAFTKWVDLSTSFTTLNNHLYFSNNNTSGLQLVSPKQYAKTINYFSVSASKEIKFRKWSLDNKILFQQVDQEDNILNVPQIVTRQTVAYSNSFFKKALFLQTGVTFNYFTKFFANDYNPVIGEFFSQTQTKIGGFPNFDIFVNGRIRQTRIFFIAEHVNSGFGASNYLSSPNNPYRDFTFRFGLVWNFFQ